MFFAKAKNINNLSFCILLLQVESPCCDPHGVGALCSFNREILPYHAVFVTDLPRQREDGKHVDLQYLLSIWDFSLRTMM